MRNSMKAGWKNLPLVDVATLQRGFDLPVQSRIAGDVPVFAANGPVGTHNEVRVPGPGVVTGRSGTIGKVHYVPTGYWPLNTSLFVKDFHGNHPKFIYYLLSQMRLEQYYEGTGVPTLNRNNIHSIEIPLPPLSEQKRIADILDKADAIRRKRREVIRLCEEFRRSLFLKLFGDPSLNRKSFPKTTLADVCGGDLRNGVSPSSKGSVRGKVLILSAITGAAFDSAAVKEGVFDNPFKDEQLVSEGNFLICRGNGNLALCGTGRFATRSFEDTVFPDTIIAARVIGTQVRPGYFEEVWSTRHVRGQIEHSARTTSGIYKVNQKTLSQISFPLPPLELQEQFDQTIRKASDIQLRLQDTLVDDLFSSLVQRAFRGEL